MRYFDLFDDNLKPMPTIADSLRNRIADLERQYKALQEENTRLKSRLETYTRRDASHLNTIKTLEEENKKLVNERSNIANLVDVKNCEIESLKKMNRNLAASNETLQKLAYKTTTKPVTTDDLLKKLQNDKPKPKPKMSEEDEKTLNRFKELMGDVSGCNAEEIVSRFLGTCLTMAVEDEFKN